MLHLHTVASKNHPRYAMVIHPHEGIHALYDIVDNSVGSEQVLAYAVRREPAVKILEALNRKHPEITT